MENDNDDQTHSVGRCDRSHAGDDYAAERGDGPLSLVRQLRWRTRRRQLLTAAMTPWRCAWPASPSQWSLEILRSCARFVASCDPRVQLRSPSWPQNPST